MRKINYLTIRRLGLAPIVLLAFLGTGVLLPGQTSVNITDYRPLAGALDSVGGQLGVVNYEDVPYQNASDLEDVSTPQQRASNPGYRLLVPRKGSVSAAITPASGGAYNLGLLLDSYRNNGNPGDFAIEQANGTQYVIATKVLSATGAVSSVSSPMKALITIPYAERAVGDTVVLILSEVSKVIGLRVEVLGAPFLPADKIAFGSSEAPARDVLASLFAKYSSTPLSYRLLFDPYPSPGYGMNIQWVLTGTSATSSPAPPVAQGATQNPAHGLLGYTKP
jgi:hypothetical protein